MHYGCRSSIADSKGATLWPTLVLTQALLCGRSVLVGMMASGTYNDLMDWGLSFWDTACFADLWTKGLSLLRESRMGPACSQPVAYMHYG